MKHSPADDKVTEEEFATFCEGQSDPMLKYIDREERSKKIAQSRSKYFDNRVSQTAMFDRKTSVSAVQFQNSYRMEPTKKFFPDKAEAIIKSVFSDALNEKKYDFATFSKLTSEMSDRIKDRVKESMDLPRYKLVSFVTVGQVKDQGVKVGSRCVWNARCDKYASASFSNGSVFAVGVIYATYFE